MTSHGLHALLLVAALAMTAAAPPDPPPASNLSAVVVVGGPRPKVAASFPADQSEVPGGVLVVKIVFDRKMAPDGWSYGQTAGAAFPTCLAHPRLLADGRTFALLCTVAAGQSYAVAINPTPQFAGEDGRSASPTLLRFSTGETGIRSLHDALAQAGLTDADEPIMGWREGADGVPHSAPPRQE